MKVEFYNLGLTHTTRVTFTYFLLSFKVVVPLKIKRKQPVPSLKRFSEPLASQPAVGPQPALADEPGEPGQQ